MVFSGDIVLWPKSKQIVLQEKRIVFIVRLSVLVINYIIHFNDSIKMYLEQINVSFNVQLLTGLHLTLFCDHGPVYH